MNAYHHVALFPDMFHESELKLRVNATQEGVPKLDHHCLILGSARIRTHGPLPNPKRISAWRVTTNGTKWRLEFRLKPSKNPLPKTGKHVGLDVGLRTWLTTSDGEKYEQHPDVVRLNKLIETQQNQRDHKHTDSNRYRELTRRIERNRQRLYDAQYDHANKIAAELVAKYDLIAFEDVNPNDKGIKKRDNPRYHQDAVRANWFLLRDVIKLRALEAGKEFILTPKWFGSQECSSCQGWVPDMSTGKEWFACKHCGYESDRDENAARVSLNRSLEIKEGTSERIRTGWWCPKGHPKYAGV